MAKYHVKMEGSNLQMTEVSPMKEQTLNRKSKAVSVRLSKNVLSIKKLTKDLKQITH